MDCRGAFPRDGSRLLVRRRRDRRDMYHCGRWLLHPDMYLLFPPPEPIPETGIIYQSVLQHRATVSTSTLPVPSGARSCLLKSVDFGQCRPSEGDRQVQSRSQMTQVVSQWGERWPAEFGTEIVVSQLALSDSASGDSCPAGTRARRDTAGPSWSG